MEDRVLVYRGADQPDMSVINPESDVWQHVKVGYNYLYKVVINRDGYADRFLRDTSHRTGLCNTPVSAPMAA
jgi:hypothetical protein